MAQYSISPELDGNYILRVVTSTPKYKKWVVPCVSKEVAEKVLVQILELIEKMENDEM